MLKLFNSLTQQKEDFTSAEKGVVKMYVCGPTVYDDPHIGHLRSAYVFEMVRRWLQSATCGYKVTFVRNVTDVDDKIIDKARASIQEGEDLDLAVRTVSKTYFDAYKRDLKRLGISEPTHEPKATEHLDDMVHLIERLVKNRAAYPAEGDVYFDVDRFKDYGRLSKQNREAMVEGARSEANTKKKHPLDFALWKATKEGEPRWTSPWGIGRPGWHIECSAMSMKYLGETFDIHGGGRDLIFPHHENETAQSEAATGKPFARTWLHHGLITVQGQKMSKSLKNYVTLDQVLEDDPRYGDEVLKLTFLGTHYSAPLDYSQERIDMDRAVWAKFLEFFANARRIEKDGHSHSDKRVSQFYAAFREAMDNDLNTPEVLARMHGFIGEAYKMRDNVIFFVSVAAAIRNFGAEVFGIVFDQDDQANEMKDEIEEVIAKRALARKNKDFKLADEMRFKLLNDKGVELRDLPDGRTTWRVKL
jgi:cysteinyl-tRNA synthetase